MKNITKYSVLLGLAILLVGVVLLYNPKPINQTSPLPSPSPTSNPVISYQCEKDKTAYELLEVQHTLETQDSDFGKMVVSIDGVKPQGNQYWAFYIDGKLSSVGAESYTCLDQEKIDWKLESF